MWRPASANRRRRKPHAAEAFDDADDHGSHTNHPEQDPYPGVDEDKHEQDG